MQILAQAAVSKDAKLFLGYVVYAGMATVVDVGTLYVLTEYFHVWYFYSAVVAYGTGMAVNFSLNKYFNFKNTSSRIASQFGRFCVVALIGLGLNQLILYFLVEFVRLWYVVAKIISVLIVMFWSFFGHKKISFR